MALKARPREIMSRRLKMFHLFVGFKACTHSGEADIWMVQDQRHTFAGLWGSTSRWMGDPWESWGMHQWGRPDGLHSYKRRLSLRSMWSETLQSRVTKRYWPRDDCIAHFPCKLWYKQLNNISVTHKIHRCTQEGKLWSGLEKKKKSTSYFLGKVSLKKP